MSATQPVVLVSGAGRGLGRAICEVFHANGYRVVASDYSAELVADLEGRDGFLPLAMDVTDNDSIAAAVAEVRQQLGRVDVVINNAGIIDYGPVTERHPDDTARLYQVNVLGSLRVVHACLDLLTESAGRVVCITSESYRLRTPFQAYQASKLALEGLADTMRRELRHLDVHLATVRPGAIKTELFDAMHNIRNPVPEGRLATPFQSFADSLANNPPKKVSRPEEVATVVFRAATDPRKRAHYEINNMMALKVANLLPKKWVDALVDKILA